MQGTQAHVHPYTLPMPYDLATLAARAEEFAPENASQPLVQPIQQATVYAFRDLDDLERAMSGQSGAAFYYRNGTPGGAALEAALAALEGTGAAVATASGMAAILAGFLAALRPGDHLLADERVYGGTYALLTEELPNMGIQVGWTDMTDLAAVEAAMRPNTKLLHFETLTNPLLTLPDVPRLAKLAHERGALLSADNTFASPAVFRPAGHGADLVSHSLAKYLNGHSTAMGGVLCGRADLIAAARTKIVRLGASVSAFDAWMTVQGLKTLSLRMRAHSQNAQAVADVLEGHPRVKRVSFPGLPSHPQFDLAAELFPNGFGGMLALEVEDAAGFVRRLAGKVPLAPSLADVATTLSWPWGTSHRALPEERRRELGITPDLLRLSVGIEDVGDLLNDLEGALEG